jgi:hypothetical protein
MSGQDDNVIHFRLEQDAQEVELREDSGAPIIPGGYSPGAGSARPLPGDRQFPFFKDPPATEPANRYLPKVELANDVVQNPIPDVSMGTIDDLGVGRAIDVRGRRLITFFFEYFPNGVPDSLVLVPQVSIFTPENRVLADWYNIGVVDPTLDATPANNIVDCGARRVFYATELHQTPAAGMAAGASCRSTLVFDVAPYDVFRMLYGAMGTDSGLNALFVRER